MTQPVTVSSKLIQDSVCPANNCAFTYDNLAGSPTLNSLAASSVLSGTGSMVVTGSNLQLTPNVTVVMQNQLTSEVVLVVPTAVSPTSFTFDVPDVQAGSYQLRVRLGELAETNSQVLTVTSRLSMTSYSGSTEGGHIKLHGNGLPTEWPATLFTIIILDTVTGISQ